MMKKSYLTLFFILSLLTDLRAQDAYSAGECFGLGALDVFMPGLGYAISGQYDKAALVGGGRWMAGRHMLDAMEQDDYQDDPDDVYDTTEAEDSESGKYETEIYMNRSTWHYSFYGGLYQNLTFFTIWDMYEHNCQPNTDAYSAAVAPLNVAHWGDNWMFWAPMAILAYNYQNYGENNKTTWYLGTGLTESQLRREGTYLYYAVGIGEEALFRGTIQKSLYEAYKDSGFTAETSRHMAIFSAAAVFGAAHTGQGFSANAASAFLFGLYEGYVYQPSVEEFDLITAIAVHTWWDILVFYTIINHSDFHESENKVGPEIPLMRISFMF